MKKRGHLEELKTDGRIRIKYILGSTVCGCGLHLSGAGQRAVAGSYGHGYELFRLLKQGEFLSSYSSYYFIIIFLNNEILR
jgi:hypothetical protein